MIELEYCPGGCDRYLRPPDAEFCSQCTRERRVPEDGDAPPSSDSEVAEFRVTFGSQYAYEPHPYFPEAHPEGWLTVLAADELAARRGVISAITNAWSSIYSATDPGWPESDSTPHPYRRGELGRLRAHGDGGWTWLRRVDGEWVPRPLVWAFRVGESCGHGDQEWVAIDSDGQVITRNVSRSSTWGRHDVGPTRRVGAYLLAVGTTQVEYRVVSSVEALPARVRERYLAGL